MTKKPVTIITATSVLQHKAGTGVVPSSSIKKCQALLDNNTLDFVPTGQSILDRLLTNIQKARQENPPLPGTTEKILECIMQLKANGGMFKFPSVTLLSNIVMDYMETIPSVDNKTISIVESLHRALLHVFENKITSVNSAAVKKFTNTLTTLCAEHTTSLTADR